MHRYFHFKIFLYTSEIIRHDRSIDFQIIFAILPAPRVHKIPMKNVKVIVTTLVVLVLIIRDNID